jgi:hypothetical protein
MSAEFVQRMEKKKGPPLGLRLPRRPLLLRSPLSCEILRSGTLLQSHLAL